jgi:mono/diheme cytochrome c family protein
MLCLAVGTAPAEELSADGRFVAAFVEKHCLRCHGGEEPEGGVSLLAVKDETALAKERATWFHAVEQVSSGAMPPEGRPKPDAKEVERFGTAVRDLFARLSRSAKPDPGVVTLRRLSKTEYVNTIRDLTGVVIPLGEDFPADQVGHGYDCIGEVLMLTPLQFDRYMYAADAIMKDALVPPPRPEPKRQRINGGGRWEGAKPLGKSFDPPGRLAVDAKGKEIPPADRLPPDLSKDVRFLTVDAPIRKIFDDVISPGEFKIIVRMRGWPVDGEQAKFVVRVNGVDVASGACSDAMEDHSFSTRMKPGGMEVAIALLNPHVDPADPRNRRGIILESVSIVSPRIPAAEEILLGGAESLEGEAKTRFVLERFATRAYRRPATRQEVEQLARIVAEAEKISWYRLTAEGVKVLQAQKLANAGKLASMVAEHFIPEDAFLERCRKVGVVGQPEAILAAAEKSPMPWDQRVAVAMRAVLCSPKFLYRAECESGAGGPAAMRPLDDHALASRLSYFIWSTMPDAELLDLAARGKLHENLPAQVSRMVADPKANALFTSFATQWLRLRALQEFAPDPALFPGFTADLRLDMLQETELFFMAVVRENRSVLDLLDAPFTFLNQRLAAHYQIRDTNGNSSLPKAKPVNRPGEPFPPIPKMMVSEEGKVVYSRNFNPFVRVNLENTPRGGLFGHASVLAVTSHPTRTSPVKRGQWVLEQLLGTPPPNPPPNTPGLEDQKGAAGLTLRQQMERHRSNPNCAGCHAKMDPLGFAFENFDALGRYREKDGDQPIDPSGELPGGVKIDGPGGLKQVLRTGKRELFCRNLTRNMLTFGLGRPLDYYDDAVVDRIVAEIEKDGHRFQTLITAIVTSDPFRMRRGETQGTQP